VLWEDVQIRIEGEEVVISARIVNQGDIGVGCTGCPGQPMTLIPHLDNFRNANPTPLIAGGQTIMMFLTPDAHSTPLPARVYSGEANRDRGGGLPVGGTYYHPGLHPGEDMQVVFVYKPDILYRGTEGYHRGDFDISSNYPDGTYREDRTNWRDPGEHYYLPCFNLDHSPYYGEKPGAITCYRLNSCGDSIIGPPARDPCRRRT
jgi:hypothetical protein